MIKRIDRCKDNNEKSSTVKRSEYISCGFSVWQYKHNVYIAVDCMKKFRESLSEHAMKIINFEKKNIIQLKNEQQELYEKTKVCCIWEV